MSYIFTNTQNLTPSTGTVAMYNLIFTGLITNAGWILEGAGDGVSNFNNSGSAGSIITGSGSGANGLQNNNAWVRLRTPTGNRELLFQRGTANYNWWVQYSFSAGFSGGTPSATTAPTATDAKNISGGNSSGVNVFFTNDGTYRQQIACDNASPYGFYSITYPTGGGECNSIQIMDPQISDSADADPYVFCFTNGNLTSNRIFPAYLTTYYSLSGCALSRVDQAVGNTNYGIPTGYAAKGLAQETFAPWSIMTYAGNVNDQIFIPGNLGTDPNTGNDNEIPIFWGRNGYLYSQTSYGPPIGIKGISSTMRWLTTIRSTGDLLSVNSTGDRLVINGIVTFPWNNTTPLL